MKIKRYIFPVLMGATMSNIMSLINTGTIVFPNILVMMLVQATVASLASLIFPAGVVGAQMTRKHFPQLSYGGFLLVSSILPAFYFTAILSMSGLLRMHGYGGGFWMLYGQMLPLNIACGYGVSLVWNVIMDSMLKKKCVG